MSPGSDRDPVAEMVTRAFHEIVFEGHPLSELELADRMDWGLGTTRWCLTVLVFRGWIREDATGRYEPIPRLGAID